MRSGRRSRGRWARAVSGGSGRSRRQAWPMPCSMPAAWLRNQAPSGARGFVRTRGPRSGHRPGRRSDRGRARCRPPSRLPAGLARPLRAANRDGLYSRAGCHCPEGFAPPDLREPAGPHGDRPRPGRRGSQWGTAGSRLARRLACARVVSEGFLENPSPNAKRAGGPSPKGKRRAAIERSRAEAPPQNTVWGMYGGEPVVSGASFPGDASWSSSGVTSSSWGEAGRGSRRASSWAFLPWTWTWSCSCS